MSKTTKNILFVVGGIIGWIYIFSIISEPSKTDPEYWAVSKELVSQQLKSPSSAKFPMYEDSWVKHIGDDVRVTGYVEAKNGFGVEIRKGFEVYFEDGEFEKYKVNIY